jgi:hypothetical protein
MKSLLNLSGALACLTIFGLVARQVSAADIIQNPGFETGTLSSWTVLGSGFGVGVNVRTPDNGPSAAGTHSAFFSNLVLSTTLGLQQTTPLGSVHAGLVNFSFDLENLLSTNGGAISIDVWDMNSAGVIIDQGVGLPLNAPADSTWHTYGGSYSAPAGTDHLKVELDATFVEILRVDNVTLTQVPESNTVTLVALGLVGVFVMLPKRGHIRSP